MQRREFLTLSVAAAAALLTGCGPRAESRGAGSENLTPKYEPLSETLGLKYRSLPIPQLLVGTGSGTPDDIKQYDLTIHEAQHSFFTEAQTPTYAVNTTYLGPTLLIKNGESVSINYTNRLSENITMHGHGLHVPPGMDGTPWQTINPGSTWSSQFTVKQQASTAWYHPHTLHKTAQHVYKGIAGMIIVEDDKSAKLNLPKRYGVDDIPLVLQDRRFDSNANIVYSPSRMEIMMGYVGDTFIVNGAIDPTFDAEAKEIRFRILNGSNSTMYNLGFSDGRSFKQIATDSGFLETPVTLTRLTLSPAERAEIVVDLTNDLNKSLSLMEYNYDQKFLTINVSKTAQSATVLPNVLTTLSSLETPVRERTFNLGVDMSPGKMIREGKMNLTINGASMDRSVVNEIVPVNQTEKWIIHNLMPMNHNFHIHATHFQVIERNGSTANIPSNEHGYKDTVHIPPRESVSILIKMTDYTDNTVPYMYHCHFLEHEDSGMMGQFTVQNNPNQSGPGQSGIDQKNSDQHDSGRDPGSGSGRGPG
ncbi:MAG: multicopper oxidase domain-containing protein, partial [Sulfurovum sp.]|nr:multicopper oxidase domain-containing protein [Sulfurovum sp.]